MSSANDRWKSPAWPFQSKADAAFDLLDGTELALDLDVDTLVVDGVSTLTGLVTATGGITTEGNVTLSNGGTVTQATSITTGVTLNTSSGQITTVSTTLAAAAEAEFVVTNSQVAATDVVIVNLAVTSSAGTPIAVVSRVAAGSFTILVANLHAANALDNTLVINFAVIKGASS